MKMQEPLQDGTIAALLAKFLPAALGAAIMCAFDMPKSKREFFWRAFVALASSYLFGDVVFDWLDSTALFSFLDPFNRKHHSAVDGLIGAFGFLVMNLAASVLKRYRDNPASLEGLRK